MVGLLTPLKPPPPDIDPEMKRLMAVDLHEDSSDEEYNPDNEVVEQVTYKHLYSKISVLIIQESLQLILC